MFCKRDKSAPPMACRTFCKRDNARVCYWEWLARDLVLRIIDFARQGNELWWLGLRAVDKSTHATVRDVLLEGRAKRSRGHIVKALDISFSKFSRHPHFCRDALHYLKAISMNEAWMVTATSSMSYWFNQTPLRFSCLYGSDMIFMKQAELFAWLIVEGLRANCAAGPITLGVLCSGFINDLRGTKGGSAGACKVLLFCNALCEAMQRVKFEESYVREVVREMIRIVQDDAKLVDGLKADARINRISLE